MGCSGGNACTHSVRIARLAGHRGVVHRFLWDGTGPWAIHVVEAKLHMLNLDGGGSTAMVISRRLINRPSDKEGERPVANAIGLAARLGCPRID